MNQTMQKHRKDQLGRSGSPIPVRLLALALFTVIVGSAWPISARSLDPACDTLSRRFDSLAAIGSNFSLRTIGVL